jgi:hypothetical protein
MWVTVVVALLVIVVGYFLFIHKGEEKTTEEPIEQQLAPVVPKTIDEELDAVTPSFNRALIEKNKEKDLDISTWNSQWKFPAKDVGCVLFTVTKPGGLVIALSDMYGREHWYDGQGYAFVVDDQNVDAPRSWISKLPIYTKEMPGCKPNWGYRMPPPPKCEDYWLVLYYGYMWLGVGKVPGMNLILAAQDPDPISGVRYFGFGSWGVNIGWGCEDGVRKEEGIVSNVRICNKVPQMPMPVVEASCQCSAPYPCQHMVATLLNLDLNKYFPRSKE